MVSGKISTGKVQSRKGPSTGRVLTTWCLPAKLPLNKYLGGFAVYGQGIRGRGDGLDQMNGFVQKEMMPLKMAG